MSRYNAYASIPDELIPPDADLSPLGDIIRDFRECVRLRHDLETAASLASGERRLRPPTWESTLANSYQPNARAVDRLAAEHTRLASDAQSCVGRLTNPNLRALAQANLTFQFPRINPGGSVRRVLPGVRSVLDLFKPLGVEENATFIKLLIGNRSWTRVWW